MKITEKVQRFVTITKEIKCDKCNEKIEKSIYEDYDAFSSQYKLIEGSRYPEGGSGELTTVDLCKKCTVEFLELLKNSGYRTNTEDWDI